MDSTDPFLLVTGEFFLTYTMDPCHSFLEKNDFVRLGFYIQMFSSIMGIYSYQKHIGKPCSIKKKNPVKVKHAGRRSS